jgi:hypothetical protein
MWHNLIPNTRLHAPRWIQTIRNQRLLVYSQSIAIHCNRRYLSITSKQLKALKNNQEEEEEEIISFWTPEERERYRKISEWQAKFTREKIPYRKYFILCVIIIITCTSIINYYARYI